MPMWSRRPAAETSLPVQRQIVARAAQVDVVGIGTPLDGVAHDVDPEALRRRQIGDVERDVADAEHRRSRGCHDCPPARATLAMNSTRLERTAHVMADDLEQRLAAVAVDVGRQRLGGRVARAAVRDSRTSASRTAAPMRPPAARAQRADRAAAVRIPAERDLGRRSAGEILAVADRAGVEHRAEPERPKAGRSRTRAAVRRWPRRRRAAAETPPASRRRPSRPGGARTACRPARRRRRRAPCARRRPRAWRGSRSRRSAPASPARRRRARASPPTRARTATRPPAKRRWLLRAPRASADSCPVSRPNNVTTRSDSP